MDYNNLVKKCIKNDQVSQRELFEIFAPKMLGVTMRYFTNIHEAEDVLQDGFIKVFTNIDKFNFKGSFEGWLRRIIVNTALDAIRKNNKYKMDVQVDDVSYKLESNGNILEDIGRDDLLEIIHDLPIGYRTVFNMFAIEGYSHKEIGEKLQISENTSKSQFSRAKSLIRKKMENVGIER